MTIAASRRQEDIDACREQVRQILHSVASFKLTFTKPVEPPSVTYVDVLTREVHDLGRSLDRVQSIVNLSAQGLLTAIVLGFGGAWALLDIPPMTMAAAAGIASCSAAALWGCITYSLRDLL